MQNQTLQEYASAVSSNDLFQQVAAAVRDEPAVKELEAEVDAIVKRVR